MSTNKNSEMSKLFNNPTCNLDLTQKVENDNNINNVNSKYMVIYS